MDGEIILEKYLKYFLFFEYSDTLNAKQMLVGFNNAARPNAFLSLPALSGGGGRFSMATNGIATEGTATEAIATNGIATEGIATNGTSSGQFSLTGRRKRGEIRSRKNKGMANIQKAGFIRPLN